MWRRRLLDGGRRRRRLLRRGGHDSQLGRLRDCRRCDTGGLAPGARRVARHHLALRPDGTLIFDRLASPQSRAASRVVLDTCLGYASANARQNTSVNKKTTVDLGGLGQRTPTVVVEQLTDQLMGFKVPRVIVQVVFGGRLSTRYVHMATEHLRNNHNIVRMIVFNVFCPSLLSNNPCRAPALAIVFGLSNPADRNSPIRIFETRSFGNVGVDTQAVNNLCGAVGIPDLEPLDRMCEETLRAPGFDKDIHGATLAFDLAGIRAHAPMHFVVVIPSLDNMRFDLVSIFIAAMEGRSRDTQTPPSQGVNPTCGAADDQIAKPSGQN